MRDVRDERVQLASHILLALKVKPVVREPAIQYANYSKLRKRLVLLVVLLVQVAGIVREDKIESRTQLQHTHTHFDLQLNEIQLYPPVQAAQTDA